MKNSFSGPCDYVTRTEGEGNLKSGMISALSKLTFLCRCSIPVRRKNVYPTQEKSMSFLPCARKVSDDIHPSCLCSRRPYRTLQTSGNLKQIQSFSHRRPLVCQKLSTSTNLRLPTMSKYVRDASECFFAAAGSHPNALLPLTRRRPLIIPPAGIDMYPEDGP
ncbi:hypothetical protein EVAR_90611_1 [Eumeta japonica]|uniref:Uncharacterized protein n=1 Tax=Eumeta variegata TaxID=151549 RepID=A0A4C1YML7_EUMVA|nr:hypothetical protein EVAR_90611_1 [Eumeta japonica]